MKKIVLLPISLLAALLFVTWGCEKDSDEDEVCLAFDHPECASLTFSSCSDGERDYFVYNGKNYYCDEYFEQGDSDPCEGASDQVAADSQCQASSAQLKSGGESFNLFLLEAMQTVRSLAKETAGCN
ncbi:hypothetical protein E9993_07895 [Labilibacter sediminis]|nr:hypothetical protein E9993_07895 [Labilibacter sediminis]